MKTIERRPKALDALTPAQERALWGIRAFIAERGYAPSVRDVAAGMGYTSVNAAVGILNILERKGRIVRDASNARTIRIVEDDERAALLAKFARLPIEALQELVALVENPFGRAIWLERDDLWVI
jgi:SOS-response transcriptional repressors (RecA-mediated autopeptidases)